MSQKDRQGPTTQPTDLKLMPSFLFFFSSNGRMNGVQRIISEQSIPVCLYYFEFISNKGDSGTRRVLVQNRKGFMKELCTGIICIVQRPQRERGILKLYFRLRLFTAFPV